MRNRIGVTFGTATRWLSAKWAAFRKPRREPHAGHPASGPVTGPLRAFRAAALWAIAIVVATADGAAFSESYRGLFEWAQHHDLSGFWAAVFPLQVDLFIVVGELVLFIAMLDRWVWRDRLGAWSVALLGLAVSIAGNIGHVHAYDLQTRGTAAVPPVAAFGALWLGLGALKRILRHRREALADAARDAAVTAERDALAGVLDELTAAVMLLATERAEPPAPPAPDPAQTALLASQASMLGELLGAVRDLSERTADTAMVPVPGDAESAAIASYRATFLAGNPWSQRQLETRWSLTRSQVARVRDTVHAELRPEPPREDGPGRPLIRYAEFTTELAGASQGHARAVWNGAGASA
jgi:hypothetical protein